jgi:hypothetical protein
MTPGRLWLLLLPAFTLLQPRATLLAGQITPNNQSSSLCRAEEQVIFSCTAAPAARTVSLCASSALDHRRGYLQYRFGKPGAIELQFPQARANTQLAFRYAHYFRAQVDRTEISFDDQGYRYTIFDYYDGDMKPVTTIAGIRVSKHGATKLETELLCQGKASSKLGSLETIIPRDPDNPLN